MIIYMYGCYHSKARVVCRQICRHQWPWRLSLQHPVPSLTTGLALWQCHYNDVIMSTIASQITSLTIVYSTVYSGADQRKRQSSASLAFVQGIHRGPVNSPHKGPVTRKMFPFDDVIMAILAYDTTVTYSKKVSKECLPIKFLNYNC